jgi:tRNA(Ile)-lysidine synthase
VRGLEAVVRTVLDRRLLWDATEPIAIGRSGGGDSVALTLMVHDWAREAARRVVILSVDHGLQPEAAGWTAACTELAATLGHGFRALTWTGGKPATGLPAAARAARHRLLAEAAREAGASVLLLGHTGDDRLEADVMRRAGSTTPDPREWSPSPAWPEGRGLFLLRPMLDVRRADLRAWLTARGQSWIDDPANADLRYARPRARREILVGALSDRITEPPLVLASRATHQAGMITISRQELRNASASDLQRLVAMACVCAGGGARRPATARIERVAEALRGPGSVVATLAGSRIEADLAQVRFFREAGEIARTGGPVLQVASGQTVVWDGRFEIAALDRDGQLTRLAGLARSLARDQQAALQALPPAARGGLPAMICEDGLITCPALDGTAANLIPDRLAAAAGLVDRELRQASLPRA